MPQPARRFSPLVAADDQVLQRPELAAEIANVTANWTLVELELQFLYSLLMGLYTPVDGDADSLYPGHPVAMQVFELLESLRARLTLLHALFNSTSEEDAAVFRKTLEPEIRARSGERNTIVHGLWFTSLEYPDDLILYRSMEEHHQVWAKRDFEDVSARIRALRDKLHAFTSGVRQSFRPQT